MGHDEDDDEEPPPVARLGPAPEGAEPRSGGEPGPAADEEPVDLEGELRCLSQPAPAEGEATDHTNSVAPRIDTARRPPRLSLEENWRGRVPPQTLGHTIMQLYGKALADQRAKATRRETTCMGRIEKPTPK